MTEDERERARAILAKARSKLKKQARGNLELLHAMRRYLYIRLMHDERGTPAARKKLKAYKVKQLGRCERCGDPLAMADEPELDRIRAVEGYNDENTRLLCRKCHRAEQKEKGYT